MNNPVIAAEGLSKKFCRALRRSLAYGFQDILTELAGRNRTGTVLRSGEFWALKDVGLTLFPAQTLGVIGPNGAGKSTLLRILNGLIKPDAGTVTVRGRIAPLIAVGAGFNPLLSGRENVFLQLALLGIARREITQKLPSILEFADIGDAIDSPTRGYSTGMLARLGFACAAHSDPSVLLIDEVLAVGDVAFRLKCYKKLHELRRAGVSSVLVSHNPVSIRSVCDLACYISQGHVKALGSASEVLSIYDADTHSASPSSANVSTLDHERAPRTNSHIHAVTIESAIGAVTSGETARIIISGSTDSPTLRFIVLVREIQSKQTILSFDSSDATPLTARTQPAFTAQITLPHLGLRPGTYFIKVMLLDRNESLVLDIFESSAFTVTSNELLVQNLYYQPHTWEFRDGC